MVELLKLIITELSSTVTLGADWVNDSTTFPYATYEYNNNEQEKKNSTLLTVDVWDKSTSVLPIETLCNSIRLKLDRKKWNNNKVFASSHFTNQSIIRDPDERYKRRRMIFEIYFYSKEVQ